MDLQISVDAESLTRRVADLIDTGRIGAARPLLAAARRMAPSSPRLAELSALLALREGRLDLAQTELDRAIADAPEHAGLRKYRADLRRQLGDRVGATQDAAEAVILDRSDPAAKALLGLLLLDLGQSADAVRCLHEAVADAPANPSFREGLSSALVACGNEADAAATLAEGIAAAPGSVALRNAAILLAVRRYDFAAAVQWADDALAAGVADACLFGLKGHALSSLGQHAEAADAYTEALKLRPDDPYVRHLVAASGAVAGAERAPNEYLRAVFDGYADRFETHLISLGYRVPGLIRAALLHRLDISDGARIGPVLDLGCGTGLLALAISDLPLGPVVGVDLSPRMLAAAAEKQLYAELREADLMHVLATDATRWPLILAADVLCYIGALDDVLAAVHARLPPGGLFVFSVEELPADTAEAWGPGGKARYRHGLSYVRQAATAAGFTVHAIDREVLRYEIDAPVPGLLAVLGRAGDDR
jgi:predicted TPR repeat methyltransferase